MSIIELIKIEFMKVKRSMILPLLLIPPILVVVSGVSSISMYMTPEYTDAWSAMFIQSALLFGYYLLPFSMVVVCVMIANREIKNNGILKMLALPVSKGKLALTKFLVLLSFLAIELLIDFHSVGRMHLWEILLFSGSPGILLHPESMLYSSPVRLLLPADIIPDSRQYSGIMPTDFLLLSYTYIIPFLLRYSVPHRQM